MCDRLCSGLSAGSGSSCDWLSGPPPLRAEASAQLLSGLRAHDDVVPFACGRLRSGISAGSGSSGDGTSGPPALCADVSVQLLSGLHAHDDTNPFEMPETVPAIFVPDTLLDGSAEADFPALPARPLLPWLRFDSIEDAQEVLSVLTPTAPCVEAHSVSSGLSSAADKDPRPPSKFLPKDPHPCLGRRLRVFATSGHLWSPSLPHPGSSFHLAWPSPSRLFPHMAGPQLPVPNLLVLSGAQPSRPPPPAPPVVPHFFPSFAITNCPVPPVRPSAASDLLSIAVTASPTDYVPAPAPRACPSVAPSLVPLTAATPPPSPSPSPRIYPPAPPSPLPLP